MNFKVIKDIEHLPKFTLDAPVFSDIETGGLYINTRLIQVYQPATDPLIYIIDIDYCDLDKVKAWLKPLWTVFHNASYDFGTLNMTTDRFDDTYYLTKTAYPEWQAFALDVIIEKFGYAHLYDGIDKKAMQSAGFVNGSYLSQAQYRYAATDVYALSLIWEDKKIQYYRDNLAYKVDILSLKYAVQYQQNGIPVDQSLVRKELDAIKDEIDNNYIFLNGLNPNSPKQCKKALNVESTAKGTLIGLISQGNKLAEVIFKQRRLLKRRTMLTSYNYPRIYTRYNVAGAITGRFTSKGGDLPRSINAQQIPRDLQYMFKSSSEDKVVIGADYATLELRIASSIFNEPAMYEQFKAGEDLHAAMAMATSGKDTYTDEERTKAKAINFGLIYGMSAGRFQEYAFEEYGVVVTLEEAIEIRNKYFTKYPAIKLYHNAIWNAVQKGGYIYETALGRRVKPKMGTDAINGPVQGSGGECTKLAIHYMVKETNGECLKYICNVVHDAIYLEVDKAAVDYWSEVLERSMLTAWREISKTRLFKFKDIPMKATVKTV